MMNEQVLANTDVVERTDGDTNDPVVNPEDSAGNSPVDPPLLQGTPKAGTVSAADPLGGTPMLLTPVVDPLEEKLVRDVPLDERFHIDLPPDESITHQATTGTNATLSAVLLDHEEADRLRVRWNKIQGKFVDEPRTAVQNADALVSDVIEKITEMFTSEHSALEGQRNQGNDISTEDLRKTLQRYRSFFNRLVA